MRYGLQLKYAVSYFAIILASLLVINILLVVRCKELVFESKYSSMQNQGTLIASSLGALNTLRFDEVNKVMELLDEPDSTRIIVTDNSAAIVYDSVDNDGNNGKYLLYSEISLALQGKNVFDAKLRDGAISGKACVPVTSKGNIIGAVYLFDYDTEQVSMLQDLVRVLRIVSVVVLVASVILSVVLALLMSRRMRVILHGFRVLGEGDYDSRIEVGGKDALGQVGRELNDLAERLKKTEAMRQRFVSDASHELKTPLAAITLLADSIVQNDSMDKDTVREFVGDIGQEAERLRRITQRLLELTRLHNNAVKKETVNLKTVSTDSMKTLRTLAAKRGVTLSGQLDDNCLIAASKDDIHQVVFNIIENAIKYNVPDGSVKVLLFSKDGKVFLLVDDTGIGVPEDKLPHIFDRFYRVDEARNGEEGSSGLGLSIVKDTVEKHGGTVTAKRREPCGMRFEVCFPLYSGDGTAGGSE